MGCFYSGKMGKKTALIIVDVQNDFGLENGALSVPRGKEVVAEINRLRSLLLSRGVNDVYLTQDWHPVNHVSFVTQNPGLKVMDEKLMDDGSYQTMWPPHCVQGSVGAQFLDDLVRMDGDVIVPKGQVRTVDSYSGFASNDGHSEKTALERLLKERGITHVLVCGLAFDYCVGFTALDARNRGFETAVVRSCSRGISEASCAAMEAKLKAAGAFVLDDVSSAVDFA